MAISNYTELQSAITEWLVRSGLSAKTPDMIMLAESSLSRKLNSIKLDATVASVEGSRELDTSSLSVAKPLGVFLALTDAEKELLPMPGSYPRSFEKEEPVRWHYDGSKIQLDTLCNKVYSFRFHYQERLKLSDANPTNWLLTNHPDVYLAACIVWGGLYSSDMDKASTYKAVLDEAIPEIQVELARRNRSVLSVDPALRAIGQ